jgi:hypothetical protein
MKSFNGSMKNGHNKFKQKIDNSHFFRKSYNTLSQINDFALPTLATASAFAPALAPVFGGTGVALKYAQTIAGKLKK